MVAVSLAKVFRRMAQPVEPFNFKLVQSDTLALLLEGIGDGLGKQPSLFGQASQGQADKLKRIHRTVAATEGRRA